MIEIARPHRNKQHGEWLGYASPRECYQLRGER